LVSAALLRVESSALPIVEPATSQLLCRSMAESMFCHFTRPEVFSAFDSWDYRMVTLLGRPLLGDWDAGSLFSNGDGHQLFCGAIAGPAICRSSIVIVRILKFERPPLFPTRPAGSLPHFLYWAVITIGEDGVTWAAAFYRFMCWAESYLVSILKY
jgi:hypothetical protein